MNKLAKLVDVIRHWFTEGKDAAIATLVRSSGTTPLPVGEMMAISSASEMQGAVSRGCVEGAILEKAQDVIRNNHATLQHFGYSDQSAWEVGLTCGGEIDVLIEPFLRSQGSVDFFERIRAQVENEEPFFLLHFLDEKNSGEKIILGREKLLYTDLSAQFMPSPTAIQELWNQPTSHIAEVALVDGKKQPAYIHYFQPASRIVIVGASEIAIYLTKMAKLVGFSVIIVDPRSMFATQARFPDADIILPKWPQDCLPSLNLKKQDALVVISHDEKIDLPALQCGLEKSIAYIGLLGSLKTRQNRFNALKEAGWQAQDLARLHAPIGLDIGSKKAEEIALSILCEIVKERNTGKLA